MNESDEFRSKQSESQRSGDMEISQMTLLKKQLSHLPAEEARQWSSFLSTTCAEVAVIRGRLAVAHDSFSRLARSRSIPPSTKLGEQMELYCTNLSEALSQVQEMDEALSDLRTAFQKRTAPYAS